MNIDFAAGLAAQNILDTIDTIDRCSPPRSWDLDELGIRLGAQCPASLQPDPALYLLCLLVKRLAMPG